MRVFSIFGEQECAGAQQRKDGVYLFDETGSVIICMSESDIIRVEGGEILIAEVSEPTPLEKLESQLFYTAMMTDTLLEG